MPPADPKVADYFINLAVCNTVVPQVLEDGRFVYQVRALSMLRVLRTLGCFRLRGGGLWRRTEHARHRPLSAGASLMRGQTCPSTHDPGGYLSLLVHC